MPCPDCHALERKFGRRRVQREISRYRRNGPDPTTAAILHALGRYDLTGTSLLDVGGGIGAIHHELFGRGIERAVHVEAASNYLDVAREEVQRRGTADRVEFVLGDFVDLAEQLGPADVVTLDRVICCYRDFVRLVTASAARCRWLYAASYPRDLWYVRVVTALKNVVRRTVWDEFRSYVHPVAVIERLLAGHGMRLVYEAHTSVWRMVLFERTRDA